MAASTGKRFPLKQEDPKLCSGFLALAYGPPGWRLFCKDYPFLGVSGFRASPLKAIPRGKVKYPYDDAVTQRLTVRIPRKASESKIPKCVIIAIAYGHTIEECVTLKYYCKLNDKRGHTEDRCKGKNNKTGLSRKSGLTSKPRQKG
ncbi:hypothetical protein HPP92_011960 [Vanilla planifolia]|uniref:Uncharacterized protein n=1 Tax=Vanilla planifolia TaxID=51239 RepID=A0A835R1L6_VANPL|nr:hypothetical protein HPP92_011960 [Vanilla planifolia]